jgi:hypothetical protein
VSFWPIYRFGRAGFFFQRPRRFGFGMVSVAPTVGAFFFGFLCFLMVFGPFLAILGIFPAFFGVFGVILGCFRPIFGGFGVDFGIFLKVDFLLQIVILTNFNHFKSF